MSSGGRTLYFGLGGGAFLFTAVLNSCVNQGQSCVPRFSYPLSVTQLFFLESRAHFWQSAQHCLLRSHVAFSSNWQWLIQICLMGRNGLLVSKTIRRNKLLVTRAIPYMVCANQLQIEVFLQEETRPGFFLIQRNISKQRSSKENVSFLKKKKIFFVFYVICESASEATMEEVALLFPAAPTRGTRTFIIRGWRGPASHQR